MENLATLGNLSYRNNDKPSPKGSERCGWIHAAGTRRFEDSKQHGDTVSHQTRGRSHGPRSLLRWSTVLHHATCVTQPRRESRPEPTWLLPGRRPRWSGRCCPGTSRLGSRLRFDPFKDSPRYHSALLLKTWNDAGFQF